MRSGVGKVFAMVTQRAVDRARPDYLIVKRPGRRAAPAAG